MLNRIHQALSKLLRYDQRTETLISNFAIPFSIGMFKLDVFCIQIHFLHYIELLELETLRNNDLKDKRVSVGIIVCNFEIFLIIISLHSVDG